MLRERNRRYLGRCDAGKEQQVGAMQPLGSASIGSTKPTSTVTASKRRPASWQSTS
jgi:hypothetical protein